MIALAERWRRLRALRLMAKAGSHPNASESWKAARAYANRHLRAMGYPEVPLQGAKRKTTRA